MRRLLLIGFLSLTTTLSAHENDPAPAPDFTLSTASGTVSLHDLRGKVVYVDFWASWCGPCRQSFPWMAAMSDKYADRGFAVVAIDLDKNRESAAQFLSKYRPPFIVAFDPVGRTAEEYRVQAMPSSFIIARSGRIVYEHEGFEQSKARVLEERIKEALSK